MDIRKKTTNVNIAIKLNLSQIRFKEMSYIRLLEIFLRYLRVAAFSEEGNTLLHCLQLEVISVLHHLAEKKPHHC